MSGETCKVVLFMAILKYIYGTNARVLSNAVDKTSTGLHITDVFGIELELAWHAPFDAAVFVFNVCTHDVSHCKGPTMLK